MRWIGAGWCHEGYGLHTVGIYLTGLHRAYARGGVGGGELEKVWRTNGIRYIGLFYNLSMLEEENDGVIVRWRVCRYIVFVVYPLCSRIWDGELVKVYTTKCMGYIVLFYTLSMLHEDCIGTDWSKKDMEYIGLVYSLCLNSKRRIMACSLDEGHGVYRTRVHIM